MGYTTTDFIEKSVAKHGDLYDYSQSAYSNRVTPVVIICKLHGPFRQVPADHYIQGSGCHECAQEKRNAKISDTKESFVKKARSVHGETYGYDEVVHVNQMTKVAISCPTHGLFSQTPNNHLGGKGCGRCSYLVRRGNAKGTGKKEFIRRATIKHRGKYTYTKVSYVNGYTGVTITCKKHGDFDQLPQTHLNGNGCPTCSSSKGEEMIMMMLDEMGIIHQREVRFKSCKNKHTLPFDFCIPSAKWLIEYHGKQHYTPVKFFGGEEKFESRKENDSIKRQWAMANGYRLTIIPYAEEKDSIKKKLRRIAKKLGAI